MDIFCKGRTKKVAKSYLQLFGHASYGPKERV